MKSSRYIAWYTQRTPRLQTARWCLLFAALVPSLWQTAAIASADTEEDARLFPPALLQWKPHSQNPIFVGGGPGAWDERIRERGTILREGDTWHFWYTGYNLAQSDLRRLGYATSKDGIHWERQSLEPLLKNEWVEDMHVVKHDGQFIMVAEGRGDIAHTLTSKDGTHWSGYRRLDVRKTNGQPIPDGPYGTPTLWYEDGLWYLFYERGDRGVWLATSTDREVWTNVQDDPVISLGPAAYDRYAIALNQIIKMNDRYYALYHANADPKWRGDWRMCLAVSDDLRHWKKCPQNPILEGDYSSGQIVPDQGGYRLYTPHPQLRLFMTAIEGESTGKTVNRSLDAKDNQ